MDAEARFLLKPAGQTEPERKRKIVGEEFIRVFEEEANNIGAVDFLAQGTIYPDIIESGAGGAPPGAKMVEMFLSLCYSDKTEFAIVEVNIAWSVRLFNL